MITAKESTYLDLMRAVASFVVLVGHAAEIFTMQGVPLWGHQAVMLFFVLSGYVISHTATTRETDLQTFLVARFARLWSVLGPAILLTLVCDGIGRTLAIHPESYAHIPADYPLVRLIAILTFTSESWVSIQPFSNGAAWSLCVEFWYYLLFAAAMFIRSRHQRLATLVLLALLAGHKALLLLPVWLMGVALSRCLPLRRLSTLSNVVLFTVAGGIAVWIMADRMYDPAIDLSSSWFSPFINTQLAQARVFWLDWAFGILVGAHLLGARVTAQYLPLERFSGPIKRCAGVSFAAYLFHMPLLVMSSAFLSPDQGWIAIAFTLTVIAVVGPPVERSKRFWSHMLNRVIFAVKAAVSSGLGRQATD